MNNDMISRAALLSVIKGLWNVLNDPEARYALSHVNRFIEVAPAVDAEPVVHGKWVVANFPGDGHRTACTNYGCPLRNPPFVPYNYCPNCGAKMDGDVNATD